MFPREVDPCAKRDSRHVNGILSLLIREYYPGMVTIDGVRQPPMQWDHFHVHTVPVPEPEGGDRADSPARKTLAAKIKREFWVSVFITTHFSILHIHWMFLKQ
jgi:hypothetical protein